MANQTAQTTTSSLPALQPLPKPAPWPSGNKARLLGMPGGNFVSPVEMLSLFDDKKFETFVHQWADEYLGPRYTSVETRGGANDKGRDVVGYIDPKGTPNGKYDNYQCKYYTTPLTFSDFKDELAKLCYYSFNKEIDIPNKYTIMTSKGIGTSLIDLINDPPKLRSKLIEAWQDNKISVKAGIDIPKQLTGEFKDYVEKFDFSIISYETPEDFIKQHESTKYHALVFGVTFKQRITLAPPTDIDNKKESTYIELALDAYCDAAKREKYTIPELDSYPHFKSHLNKARVNFYSAESLKEFSRDNFLDDAFESLLTQFEDGITPTYCQDFKDGYQRMLHVCSAATSLQIDNSHLKSVLSPSDRIGLCHHLANEGRTITSWRLNYGT